MRASISYGTRGLTSVHIGHNADDFDHESLAMRHLGEGILREQAGNLQEALNEYMLANVLDPGLELAQIKLALLNQKLGFSVPEASQGGERTGG